MTNVYLFKPGNIDSLQWSTDEIERIYGAINLYSFYSDSFWVGTGSFGYGIDYRYDGYGLQQGTSSGSLTGMAGYVNGDVAFSVDEFNVSISDLINFTSGEPLAQFGIFDGSDYMSGSTGNDVLTGYRGADDMWGSDGDDVLRAGNGADMIWGANGNDVLYGGFGRNTFEWEADGYIDKLYIKSDQFAYNYLYDSAGNNPNGAKADIIYSLDSFDKIYIQGVSASDLSFANVSGGIGISAGGYLEATYIGGNLNVQQLQSMTSGVSA